MVNIEFDLDNYDFEMLAQLKESDPEWKDKTFNDYAKELLINGIYLERAKRKQA